MAGSIPSHARAVIVGGGIVGCSVAYHLTKLGWRDIVLLERRDLSCGTTWHAAGLVGQLRSSHNLTRLASYGAVLYEQLEAETGQATGFRRSGSISVARTKERLIELKRGASMAKCFGVEVEVISPGDAGRLWPLMRTDDLAGAVWIPRDGRTNPIDTTLALAKGARKGGATLVENVTVTGIHRQNGAATGVSTDHGDIACDVVVNCAGMWGRELGRMAGVNVPLHASEHFYIVTEPMAGVTRELPVLRDTDGGIYVREEVGGLLMGGFESVAKPWGMHGLPKDFAFSLLPEDWEHFRVLMEQAIVRIPALETAPVRRHVNGPESFTPDNRYMLGEAPELRNFFVAAGFNSVGIASAAGAGKALAEWIVGGEPSMDLWDVDIRRFMPFQGNARYLYERTREVVGLLYAMHWPFRQPASARGVRRSVLHDRLAARGAVFGVVAGWERANWFATAGVEPRYVYTYGRQNWFPCAAAEHRAVREGVGLFDQSSLAKFRLQGPDATAVLQRLCTNDVDLPPGRIVYTQMLNPRGGIECDFTITRLEIDRFLIITGTAFGQHDLSWLRINMPELLSVADVTSNLACIGLWGPLARRILQKLTKQDISTSGFPYMTMQEITVGDVPAYAFRVTYVGELGWEFYCPMEYGQRLWDVLWEAGEPEGLVAGGYRAIDSLRLEKGYRYWSADIGPDYTPFEAGLGFAVKLNKGNFIGREALLRQKQEGLRRKLCCLTLAEGNAIAIGNEPIRCGGTDPVLGWVTSGGYGYSVRKSIAYGYLPIEHAAAGTVLDVELLGERIPAVVNEEPLWDPTGARIRA